MIEALVLLGVWIAAGGIVAGAWWLYRWMKSL